MWRSPLVLLATGGLAGCLWIGPASHEARKAKMAIDLEVGDVSPDAWSTCVDDPPLFVVTGTVSPIHAGAAFDAWFEVEGDTRRPVPKVTAGPPAEGRSPVAFTLDLTESLAALPACDDVCEIRIRVGLDRIELSDEQEVTVQLIGDREPDLAGADLLDASDGRAALDGLTLSQNPPDSVSVATWPTVLFEMDDPHLPVGLAGGGRIAYCPDGTDPLVDPELCAVTDADTDTVRLAHGGDMAFFASTASFGELSCRPENATVRWRLWGILDDHVCGAPLVRELTTAPLRLVDADCDADGVPAPADCADDDPARNPDLPEVWYDGQDTDCSGGSDYDQDGDGADGPSDSGPDCDDTNPSVAPGLPEVCDNFDNDCDGLEPSDQVTVFSVAGAVVHAGADPLGDALASAVPGDDVVLCAGTYTGNFQVLNDLTLRSATGSAADVAIVGLPGAPALDVDAATVTIRELTFRDSPDGAIDAVDAADLVVEDCEIHGNSARRGAGILAAGSLTIRRTTISDNVATESGGGIAVEPATSVFLEQDVLVTRNLAANGGGLHLVDANVTADDTVTIETNQALGDGGGVWASGSLFWDGAVVLANEAVNGGGFHLEAGGGAPTWTIEDAIVQNHVAPTLLDGAGIHAVGPGTLQLSRVELLTNSAGDSGGGLYATSAGDPVLVELTTCTVEGNEAALDGGGVAVENAELIVRGGDVRENQADYGAGIHGRAALLTIGEGLLGVDVKDNFAFRQGGGIRLVSGLVGPTPELSVHGSEIERNNADYGGGIYLDPDDPVTVHVIDDGTLTENVASVEGGGMYVDDGSVQLAGTLLVELNTPDGIRLVDEEIEACVGVTIDDPVTNGSLDQGTNQDCFEVTATTVASSCGC